jgi:predicted small secreted protein
MYQKLFFLPVLFCFFLAACNSISDGGQDNRKQQVIVAPNPYAIIDKSPLDVSYYPVNYPMLKMEGKDTTGLVARVFYSRPQKNGRKVFGNELPPQCIQQYGTYWRLGANESSEIEFFKPVGIEGQNIPKGRYTIYCIPFENEWTVILNNNLYSWGLHVDSTKDFAKIKIPVAKMNKPIEYFTMVFHKSAAGTDLIMTWDDVKAVLPISFN